MPSLSRFTWYTRLATDDQGRRTVMLVASLQVAANKCCHAATMPAGGPEPAAGHDLVPDQTRPLHFAPAASDCPANSDRLLPRGFLAGHNSLRLAHRRDEERTNTWNTSGMYRFFLLGTRIREGMEVKVEEVEEEEENDRVRGIERRTTSPAGFGYPAGRWNGRIVEPARTSSSARCKWRIGLFLRQYYAEPFAVSAMYTAKSEIYCRIDPAEAEFFCPSSFEWDSSPESTNYS